MSENNPLIGLDELTSYNTKLQTKLNTKQDKLQYVTEDDDFKVETTGDVLLNTTGGYVLYNGEEVATTNNVLSLSGGTMNEDSIVEFSGLEGGIQASVGDQYVGASSKLTAYEFSMNYNEGSNNKEVSIKEGTITGHNGLNDVTISGEKIEFERNDMSSGHMETKTLTLSSSGLSSTKTDINLNAGSNYKVLYNSKEIATVNDIPTSLPANGGNSTTVNGHTVNADVPSGAKFTDTIYTLPDRLGGICQTITDWNNAIGNGWYMGSNIANAPTTGWYFGQSIVHNSNYILQEVYAFASSTTVASNKAKYIRVKFNGTWGDWCNVTVQTRVPENAKFTDTNTWRPLGTSADTACAGNDSRLSDARPANGGTAEKATKDGSGNVIIDTYAKKTDIIGITDDKTFENLTT